MRTGLFVLCAASLVLGGCDQITGAAEDKAKDAEAIGYACRVSSKTPEACMKENEAQSPTAVLAGWKNADKDIAEGNLDPSMGTDPAYKRAATAASAPAGESAVAEAAPEAKPEGKEKTDSKELPDKKKSSH